MMRHTALPVALLLTISLLAAPALSASATAALAPTAKSAPLMNTPRPLFFHDLVALDTKAHRSLALPAERKSFAFAAEASLIPLTVAEVGPALHAYPLVFLAEGENIALVALTGLPGTGNRFVNAQGEWRPNTYIPAYVRGYPFIAIRPSDKAEPILAFDPQASDFKAPNSHPLLSPDGQPSEQLKGIMAFQGEYRQLADRTLSMTRALKAAGVLEDGSLQLKPVEGGDARKIDGFLVVSEAKLKALPADALKKLMDADALGIAYAQLLSMGNLGNLFSPVQTQAATKAQTSAPKAGNRKPKKSGE